MFFDFLSTGCVRLANSAQLIFDSITTSLLYASPPLVQSSASLSFSFLCDCECYGLTAVLAGLLRGSEASLEVGGRIGYFFLDGSSSDFLINY
jgi:hypothetical protein